MANYEKKISELVERADKARKLDLHDYIMSEGLQTYRIEALTILDVDRVNNAVIPCLEYMILAHERCMNTDEHPVAQYAIYRQEEPWNQPLTNSLSYSSTYILESVCDETYDNMALAICHATSEIYMRERKV